MRERVIPSRAPVPASRCHGLKPAVLTLFLLPVITASSECQPPPATRSRSLNISASCSNTCDNSSPDLAISELQKVIELNPGNVDARGNLGVLYFFRGNYKDAVPPTARRPSDSARPVQDPGATGSG
jgi:hypothetical protein